ncbi:hypothetical protein EGN72_10450 [Pseudorhodobacter sp. E13]|uniref:hypothetical protein n=1 Tax=Pseudorhodobacter sp. E13 TaxID=2487931 RepID=UPI000F8CBA98|nr:hypothetical protein [Pseudorhodobacter sp. E13]RUS60205.1 hypothetical protein EGN72_10450 [Pseudorhodobacter sp. E13]
MSEFTDYMQVLTDAASLAALRGQLVQSVGAATVPLLDLPYDVIDSESAAEAAWAALPKPRWVMLGTDAGVTDLANIGPAFHLLVEEDFISWSVVLICGTNRWNYAFLRQPDMYREATAQYGDTLLWDGALHKTELAQMAACLGTTATALEPTFIADGGQAFSALIGAHYEQMEDLSYPDLAHGTVEFPFTE